MLFWAIGLPHLSLWKAIWLSCQSMYLPRRRQKYIYYIISASKDWVVSSAFMECLKKWDFKMIFIPKPIFRCCMQQVRELYGGKPGICGWQRARKDEKKNMEENKRNFKNLWKLMKILDKKVEKVSISNKLISSLCCPNTPRQLYNGLHDRQKARRYPHRPPHYGEPAADGWSRQNGKAFRT